jgi:hypothetical protein
LKRALTERISFLSDKLRSFAFGRRLCWIGRECILVFSSLVSRNKLIGFCLFLFLHYVKCINVKQQFCSYFVYVFFVCFIARDADLVGKATQLQYLDDICSSTTKRFMQFEMEYAWHAQPMRRKILTRILKRYKTIPQISELTNIEEDLSWEDFCLWYANRNKIVNQLEQEFSDFVEDQREKEGRLFYRWHKSLYRAKEAHDLATAAAAAAAAAAATMASVLTGASASASATGGGGGVGGSAGIGGDKECTTVGSARKSTGDDAVSANGATTEEGTTGANGANGVGVGVGTTSEVAGGSGGTGEAGGEGIHAPDPLALPLRSRIGSASSASSSFSPSTSTSASATAKPATAASIFANAATRGVDAGVDLEPAGSNSNSKINSGSVSLSQTAVSGRRGSDGSNKAMNAGDLFGDEEGVGANTSSSNNNNTNAAAAGSGGSGVGGVGVGVGGGSTAKLSTVTPAAATPGGQPAVPTSPDGIVALKVTPFSIKAFIKYFANDVIGVQYGIPRDCMAANVALTEALFFRY